MEPQKAKLKSAPPARRTPTERAVPAKHRVASTADLNFIAFHVRGLPVSQGSARAWLVNGKPVITSTAKGLATWRRLVADVAQGYAPPDLWEGPLHVDLTFGLPKPKSAPKTRRVWPDKRPDLDKLTRAVLDSLTHIVFRDDSQIVGLSAVKDYGPPGVLVEIRRVVESEIS